MHGNDHQLKVFSCRSSAFEHIHQEFFLPSIPPTMALESIKIPDKFAQQGVPGCAERPEFTDYIYDWAISALEQHLGEVILFAGCDQEFFSDCTGILLSALGDADIAAAREGYRRDIICGDFRLIRSSRRIIDLFKATHAVLGFYHNDQDAMTAILRSQTCNVGKVRFVLLPHAEFWNYGEPPEKMEDDYVGNPPSQIRWFHANSGGGPERKAFLLRVIRDRVRAGSFQHDYQPIGEDPEPPAMELQMIIPAHFQHRRR